MLVNRMTVKQLNNAHSMSVLNSRFLNELQYNEINYNIPYVYI